MQEVSLPENISNNFTKTEITEYFKQFKNIDRDDSGTLDKDEMVTLMINLGMQEIAEDDEKIDALMKEVDEDGDGVVSLVEFFVMMNSSSSALTKALNKKLINDANAEKEKEKKQMSPRKRLSARLFKNKSEEDFVGETEIKTLTDAEAVVVSTFLAEEGKSFKDLNLVTTRKDRDIDKNIIKGDGIEKKKQNVYLLDGSTVPVVITEKSRAKHVIVQIKENLKLKHDCDFALYLNPVGEPLRMLKDDDLLANTLNQKKSPELLFKRRFYLPWSPLSSESRDATDAEEGAHRLSFIEAQYRFLNSHYPTFLGEAVERKTMKIKLTKKIMMI
eukprot:g2625.t1